VVLNIRSSQYGEALGKRRFEPYRHYSVMGIMRMPRMLLSPRRNLLGNNKLVFLGTDLTAYNSGLCSFVCSMPAHELQIEGPLRGRVCGFMACADE
jgi:hypothetical protein